MEMKLYRRMTEMLKKSSIMDKLRRRESRIMRGKVMIFSRKRRDPMMKVSSKIL